MIVWNAPVRYGVIGGLVNSVVALLIYILADSAFASDWYKFSSFALVLFFTILGGIEFRKDNDNNISYGQSLLAVLAILTIITVCVSVFMFILTMFVDLTLPQRIQRREVQEFIESYQNMNYSDEQIDLAVKERGYMLGWMPAIVARYIFGVLVSLVVAAFVKRNPNKTTVVS